MGFKREFNFEDDIELLNLKYQFNNTNLSDYFQNEIGANEEIYKETKENPENTNEIL